MPQIVVRLGSQEAEIRLFSKDGTLISDAVHVESDFEDFSVDLYIAVPKEGEYVLTIDDSDGTTLIPLTAVGESTMLDAKNAVGTTLIPFDTTDEAVDALLDSGAVAGDLAKYVVNSFMLKATPDCTNPVASIDYVIMEELSSERVDGDEVSGGETATA